MAFESGAECYNDDYGDALDALAKAGYTDRIIDSLEGGESDGKDG